MFAAAFLAAELNRICAEKMPCWNCCWLGHEKLLAS